MGIGQRSSCSEEGSACSDGLDGQAVDETVERAGVVVAGLVVVGGDGGDGQWNR
jgi:hypothetical protein